MGHVKEPEGIDFIIQSNPLTDAERKAISQYILDYKANQSGSKSKKRVKITHSKEKFLA